MGAITAQILIGQSHPYEGGLVNLEGALLLTENGVARWSLNPWGRAEHFSCHSWIPDPGTMLEDGLLLLGLHVWKDEMLLQFADKAFQKPLNQIEMLTENVISDQDRYRLHERCRSILQGRKLVITVLEGSSIKRQLDVLFQYPFEVEVCVPTYNRTWNVWTQTMVSARTLDE